MKTLLIAALAAAGLVAATPASATGGGFGFGSFMDGFARGQAARAAMMQAMQNSPYGRCVSIRAEALMRQKQVPPANVVHAQMDAIKAYCREAFMQ
jgi:hypothetical protein